GSNGGETDGSMTAGYFVSKAYILTGTIKLGTTSGLIVSSNIIAISLTENGVYFNGSTTANIDEVDVAATMRPLAGTATMNGDHIVGMHLENPFGNGSTTVMNTTKPVAELSITPTINVATTSTAG